MPLPVALVDRDLLVHDASETYAEIAGAGLPSLLGAPLAVVFAADDAVERARRAVAEGARFEGWGATVPSGFAVRVRIEALDGEDRRALALISLESERDATRLAELYAAIRAIKHEINNPLTGALGNITLLLRRADLDEKTRRRLATVEQELKKVNHVVLRLSDLAPSPEVKPTPN
jgi:signal transduction histidine kinase